MNRLTASAADESTPAAPAFGAKLGDQPSKERTYAIRMNSLSGSVRYGFRANSQERYDRSGLTSENATTVRWELCMRTLRPFLAGASIQPQNGPAERVEV